MSDKVSGCKKASATSAKKGGTKSFCPVAMPKSYLPCTWNFILGISGMMIILGSVLFLVQWDIVGTQRQSQNLGAAWSEIKDENLILQEWQCFLHLDGEDFKDKNLQLTFENDWTNYNAGQKPVNLSWTDKDAHFSICRFEVCSRLDIPKGSGKFRWDLPGPHSGYLDCNMPKENWYNYIRQFESFKKWPLTQPSSPVCVYYANDGTLIRLNDDNEWSVVKDNKQVSLKCFRTKLMFNSGDGNAYRLDVKFELLDSTDDYLRWTFQGGYLECKPKKKFRDYVEKLPHFSY